MSHFLFSVKNNEFDMAGVVANYYGLLVFIDEKLILFCSPVNVCT